MSSSSNEEALLHTPTLGKLQDDTGSSEKDLESLCRDCEAVDWSKITIYDDIEGIQTDLPTYHGDRQMKVLRIFKNPIRAQLLGASCRVCRLVGLLSNPHQSSDIDPQAFVLEADSWNPSDSDTGYAKYVKIRVRSPKSGVQHLGLGDDYERWLIAHKYPSSESVQIRVLRPSQVCFEFFRLKLEECYNGHEKCCYSATASVGLRLIDVHTKHIINAIPDCKYIALSYVWGNTSAHNVESPFPPVVEDAISATKALGCQYLWVDRCCIDQTSDHKHLMIQQMDRVYGNAFATIIAASGKSSQEGLPGMSGPPRRPQEAVKVGDTNIVELFNVGQEIVKSGKWVTRGWTYQEGYLSKRRLIFTQKEVLLLCNEELVKETQAGKEADPYWIMHLKQKHFGGEGTYTTSIRDSFSWMTSTEATTWTRLSHLKIGIEEYSSRELSDPSDSLNALLGIFRYFELFDNGGAELVSHLWGVPLKINISNRVSFNILWQREAPTIRVPAFPSWSWLGWSGPFHFTDLDDQLDVYPGLAGDSFQEDAETFMKSAWNHNPRIQLPGDHGPIDLHQFMRERALDTDRNTDPREIVIQSYVISLRLRKVACYPGAEDSDWDDPSAWTPREPVLVSTFLLKTGVFVGIPAFFDRDYDPNCHTRGLVLHNPVGWRGIISYSILILHPLNNSKYERAGIVNLEYAPKSGSIRAFTPGFNRIDDLGDWSVYMDEGDRLLTPETGEVTEGCPHEYLFLKDMSWETVRLV